MDLPSVTQLWVKLETTISKSTLKEILMNCGLSQLAAEMYIAVPIHFCITLVCVLQANFCISF